jgi:phage shock protein C
VFLSIQGFHLALAASEKPVEEKNMFCNYCGKTLPDDAYLCAYCGKRVAGVIARKRLVRPRQGRKIAGVCQGFAEYFDLDVTLVRIVWAICALFGAFGAVAYGAAWIVMPEEPLLLAAPAPTQDRVVNT